MVNKRKREHDVGKAVIALVPCVTLYIVRYMTGNKFVDSGKGNNLLIFVDN